MANYKSLLSAVVIAVAIATPGRASADREVIDLTRGTRTDPFTTAALAPDGTLYVGTLKGRIYRSAPAGQWDELTVLPEVKELHGFSNQFVHLGHLRTDDSQPATPLNLHPPVGVTPDHAIQSLSLLHGGLRNVHLVGSVDSEPIGTRASSLELNRALPWAGQTYYSSPLDDENSAVLDSTGVSAGAGLSARAPRLSLLQRAWKRPIAAINLQVFLRTRGRRTRISRIAIDPQRPSHLFTATRNGLYESVDRGDSFVRVFPGITRAESDAREIIYDPHDPRRLFLGTGRGLFVSTDGGLSFTKHGFVPEVTINKVAFDPVDPSYIYVATSSGAYRSRDGGETFSLGFFSSLRKQRSVYWVEVDKNDPGRVYLGTGDGAFTTADGPAVSPTGWDQLSGMRTLNLAVYTLTTCKGSPGHIYAQTSAALPTNLYFGNSPESYLLETRDGGVSWAVAAAGRSRGTLNWFEVDPDSCDRVWTLWSNAILESRPRSLEPAEARSRVELRDPSLPSMSAVIAAALAHQGLELEIYSNRLDSLRSSRWLPTRVNATFFWGRTTLGSNVDDFQFADERYRSIETTDERRVMAWASWDLPSIYYRHDAIPMLRSRVKWMNDKVRNNVMTTVFRHYRELLEARARERAGIGDLYSRSVDRVLYQQHFAVVDLATGGFLSRSQQQKKKKKGNQ